MRRWPLWPTGGWTSWTPRYSSHHVAAVMMHSTLPYTASALLPADVTIACGCGLIVCIKDCLKRQCLQLSMHESTLAAIGRLHSQWQDVSNHMAS